MESANTILHVPLTAKKIYISSTVSIFVSFDPDSGFRISSLPRRASYALHYASSVSDCAMVLNIAAVSNVFRSFFFIIRSQLLRGVCISGGPFVTKRRKYHEKRKYIKGTLDSDPTLSSTSMHWINLGLPRIHQTSGYLTFRFLSRKSSSVWTRLTLSAQICLCLLLRATAIVSLWRSLGKYIPYVILSSILKQFLFLFLLLFVIWYVWLCQRKTFLLNSNKLIRQIVISRNEVDWRNV